MKEVEVAEIRVSTSGQAPVVVLRERTGDRLLPVWMSSGGAAAIVSATDEPDADRPVLHDLVTGLLAKLGAPVSEVQITDYRDGQFYAQLRVGEHSVVARPSDAIALALRAGCPILVADEVLDAAGVLPHPQEEVERFKEFLDTVVPDDFSPS